MEERNRDRDGLKSRQKDEDSHLIKLTDLSIRTQYVKEKICLAFLMNSDHISTLQPWPSTPCHLSSPNTYITFLTHKYEQIKVFLLLYYRLEIEREDGERKKNPIKPGITLVV